MASLAQNPVLTSARPAVNRVNGSPALQAFVVRPEAREKVGKGLEKNREMKEDPAKLLIIRTDFGNPRCY